MPSDVFRPRLPIDPFANAQHTTPWRIPADLKPSPPQVIFLLGEPTLADLVPLLHSPQLATSLLLIATHAPLSLPPPPTAPSQSQNQGPAIRVLRLAAPPHVHDTGALRLVGLFERAQRVAAAWRNHPSPPHVLYFAEDELGEFRIVDAPAPAGKGNGEEKYPSPAPSISSAKRTTPESIKNRLSMLSESLSLSMSLSPSSSSRRNSIASLTSSESNTISSSQKARPRSIMAATLSQLTQSLSNYNNNTSVPTSSSSAQQRAFDAIVNFLPSGGVPEKALFKHAILVTTLSAQYLSLPHGAAPESGSYHYQRRGSSPPHLLPISPSSTPPRLSLSHLSSDSAPPSTSSSSCSLSSSLAAPPKAQINSVRQRHQHQHHRRFSSFALSSASLSESGSSSSIATPPPEATGPSLSSSPLSGDDDSRSSTPGLGLRPGSSYGLFSGASAASTAATTPALELSTDELALTDDYKAQQGTEKMMTRRRSMTKRLSTLFSSVSRPVSISSTADLDLEMGVLGKDREREREREQRTTRPRTRPLNAHIIHILPADWVPAPSAPAPPPSSSPYGKGRAYSNPTMANSTHQKPKLVQGIEQFLLSFAYPLAGLSSASSPSSSSPASSSRPQTRRAPGSGLGAGTGAGAPPPSAFRQGINSVNTRPASWGAPPATGQGQGHLASLLGQNGEESFRARAVPYLVAPGMFGRALGGGGGNSRKGKGKEVEGRGWLGMFEEQEEEEEEIDEDGDEDEADDSDAAAVAVQPRSVTRVRRRRVKRRNLTLGEALLLGALDLDADFSSDSNSNAGEPEAEEDAVTAALGSLTGKRWDNRAAVGCGRVWVGERDVEVVGASEEEVVVEEVVEVRRRTTVRRKADVKEEADVDVKAVEMEDKDKDQVSVEDVKKEKEDATTSEAELGLPTPPRSQRSSVTSSSASSSHGHEGDASANSSAAGTPGELTRSNSTGSCSGSGSGTPSTSASQVELHTQDSKNTITISMTSARASVIAVPPRAAVVPVARRRVSGEEAAVQVAMASSGDEEAESKMVPVLGGVPMTMTRSPSVEALEARLLNTRVGTAEEGKQKEKEGELAIPDVVHLLGGAGQSSTSTTPSSSSAAPIESSAAELAHASDSGVAAMPAITVAGPDSIPASSSSSPESSASANPTALAVPPATATATAARSSSLRSRLSLRMKTRPKALVLLREQTKAKVGGKERPASMVILGGGKGEPEEGERTRKDSFGVGVIVGSALRRVQGLSVGVGAGVFGKKEKA